MTTTTASTSYMLIRYYGFTVNDGRHRQPVNCTTTAAFYGWMSLYQKANPSIPVSLPHGYGYGRISPSMSNTIPIGTPKPLMIFSFFYLIFYITSYILIRYYEFTVKDGWHRQPANYDITVRWQQRSTDESVPKGKSVYTHIHASWIRIWTDMAKHVQRYSHPLNP